MKNSTLSLKLILENIIKEVGDLNNIQPYKYQNNEFVTEEGWKVTVSIDDIDDAYYEYINLPFKQKYIKVISYKVEGEQSQYKKTTYTKLIKILKTVTDIIIEYINNNSNIKALLIFAANKNPDKLLSSTDPQKSEMYKAIILKQISQLNQKWTLKDIDIVNYKGFLIYKK
jgi:hypothetical protein